MGRRAGIDRISRMAEEFGLGKTTGIDLAGESDGNVASEAYKMKVFKQDWYLGETMDAAIGQSFTLTTPLQMAMVYSAIANGGFRYQPYLVNRIDQLDGTPLKIFSPEKVGTLPVSKDTLDAIHKGLRMVMSKDGTGGRSSNIIRFRSPVSLVRRKRMVSITAGSWHMRLSTSRRS